jgi:hypothetical protein
MSRNARLTIHGLVAGVVAIATCAALSPAVNAQCATGARHFASVGGNTELPKVRILPGASRGGVLDGVGTEIGRFWQSADSTLGHNFLPGDPDFKMDPLRCPTQGETQAGQGWWQVAQTTKRGVTGLISGTGCMASTCPFGDMTFVIEDFGSSGPPGINDTAHFIGFRVDQTPGDYRYWDLAKVAPPDTDLLFIEFPVVTVTSSFKQGTDRVVTMNFANISFHVHGQSESAPIPATEIIASYDLMVHSGDTDPGRLRYADTCDAPNPGGRCWTLVQQTPFTGVGPQGVSAVVPCESVTKDSFVALGISFKGGVGPNVPSALVGRAVQIECDPNLADPRVRPSPSVRTDERPDSRGVPSRSRTGR